VSLFFLPWWFQGLPLVASGLSCGFLGLDEEELKQRAFGW
jgi:hypothetical protein